MSVAGPPTASLSASPTHTHAPAMVPLVGFDIETDTTTGGLDPETAPIVAVAVSIRWASHPATAPDATEVRRLAELPAVEHVFTGPEPEILTAVDAILRTTPPGYLVTWNGASFDLPFVGRRTQIAGVEIGLEVAEDPSRRSRREPERAAIRGRWHQLVHLDGYLLYRADVGMTLGISCGLKPLARLVGMQPVELDQASLHLESDEAIAAYVASDARTAVDLVLRRWPNAASVADSPPPRLGIPFTPGCP